MKNEMIAYNRFVGCPLKVVNIGKAWWVLTPGEEMTRLEQYSYDASAEGFGDIEVVTTDNRVRWRPLLRLLGCAASSGFSSPGLDMASCLESLEDMGAEVDQPTRDVTLRGEVLTVREGSQRKGQFMLLVYDTTGLVEHCLVNSDGFEDWHDAVEAARDFETWLDEYMLQWGFRCKIKEMKLPDMKR